MSLLGRGGLLVVKLSPARYYEAEAASAAAVETVETVETKKTR